MIRWTYFESNGFTRESLKYGQRRDQRRFSIWNVTDLDEDLHGGRYLNISRKQSKKKISIERMVDWSSVFCRLFRKINNWSISSTPPSWMCIEQWKPPLGFRSCWLRISHSEQEKSSFSTEKTEIFPTHAFTGVAALSVDWRSAEYFLDRSRCRDQP